MPKSTNKQIPVMISICFWCGNEKEEILIGKKAISEEKIQTKAIGNYDPCEQCKSGMSNGITLIEATENPIAVGQKKLQHGFPTGRWAVLPEETIRSLIQDEQMLKKILKSRKTLTHPEVFAMLFEKNKDENQSS